MAMPGAASQRKEARILFCSAGDLVKVRTAFERFHKSHGPFSFGIVIGDCSGHDAVASKEWPFTTYIVGDTSGVPATATSDNLQTLVGSGLVKTAEGVMIGYCGSDEDKDVRQLSNYGGTCDILVSKTWASGILNGSAAGKAVTFPRSDFAPVVRKLSTQLRPRYHVASGSHHLAFEREPYVSVDPDDASESRICRFINLGPFRNTLKQRWFLAINLSPVPGHEKPKNCTESPFENKRKREMDSRWLTEDARDKKKRRAEERRNILGTCWFCMSNEDIFATHLLVSILDRFYVALPKGGLSPRHCLIVPIEHSCQLQDSGDSELKQILRTLTKVFNEHGEVLVHFETVLQRWFPASGRLVVADRQHGHVQAVPLPKGLLPDANAEERLCSTFTDKARENGFTMTWTDRQGEPKGSHEAVPPLFCVTLPSGKVGSVYHPKTQDARFDSQFGRRVLAEFGGMPAEKGDWRLCELQPAREAKIVEEFRDDYQRFDSVDGS